MNIYAYTYGGLLKGPPNHRFNTKKEPHVELFDATYVFLRTPKVVDKVMFLEHEVFRTYAAIIS